MYDNYAHVLTFLLVAVGIVLAPIIFFALIRPIRPSTEKLSTYECGERPVGSSWIQFNIRYYLICIIFLIFEVEVLFMFPWAVVFNAFKGGAEEVAQIAPAAQNIADATGTLALVEMLIFVAILAVGLAYVWGKGHLEWVKEMTVSPEAEEIS